MATTIRVYTSSAVADIRVSSAARYDEALMTIFPHFAYVSFEDARKLTQVIEAGMQGRSGMDGVGSYASTMDFRTNGKVLWMSDSSYLTLREWLDPEEYVITEIPTHKLYNGAPTHMVGGE